MTEFEIKFQEEMKRQIREIEKPNLLVVGGTGVGKSSLINRIFGKNVARTGAGEPVTRGLDRYEHPHTPIVFFDAEGYEISADGNPDNSNFKRNVVPKIEEKMAEKMSDQIHLVWYCISIANHRVTDYDLDNMQYFFRKNMKVAIVFTQCDSDDENGSEAKNFKKVINDRYPKLPCFETCATEISLELDLEKLIAWSMETLPTENLRKSFVMAQKASISEKKKKAYAIVATVTATTAGTAGLNPIPVSDALLIAPQQLGMCIQITNIFWMGTGLSSGLTSLLQTQILSILGKQAVASLLKLIPGLGQIINAGVAGFITFALGAVLIELNANALKEYLDTAKMPNWSQIFSSKAFISAISEAMKKAPKDK